MLNNTGCVIAAGLLLPPFYTQAITLQQATVSAIHYDAAIRSSQKTHDADTQKRWQGMAGMLPQVGLEGGWSRQEQPQASYQNGVTSHNYSLRVQQPLFDMSKIAAWQKGDAIASTADAQLRQAGEKLVTDVADAYFSVLHQREVLQAAKAAGDNVSRQLSKLRNGLRHGQNTRTEVDEAQANADVSSARAIQAENDLLLAGEGFRRLTGLAPETVEELKPQCIRQPVVSDLAEALRQAQHNNIQVRIAHLQAEQSAADISAATAAHLPVVSAWASYGKNWSRSENDSLLYNAIFGTESKSDNLQYGVNVSIPLFSGGAQLSQSFEAASRHQAAKYAVADAQRKAAQDTRSAWLTIKNGAALVDAQTQAVISAKSKVRSIEYGKEMGFRTVNDELDAQQKYFEAVRDLSEAKYRYLTALLNIAQLTGNLEIAMLGRFDCR